MIINIEFIIKLYYKLKDQVCVIKVIKYNLKCYVNLDLIIKI